MVDEAWDERRTTTTTRADRARAQKRAGVQIWCMGAQERRRPPGK
jgi:hypothetical protein